MKLLFLSSFYPPITRGGGEISTHYIAKGLQELGHQVAVLTDGEAEERAAVEGIEVHRIPLGLKAKPLFEKSFSQRVAEQLKAGIGDPNQWEYVHAHDFRMAQALALLGWKNIVVTTRDYAQICGPTNEILSSGEPGDCCSWDNLLFNNPRVMEASFPRNLFRIWQYKYNLAFRKQSFRQFPAQVFISAAQQALIAQRQNLRSIKTNVIYNPVSDDYLAAPVTSGKAGSVLYVGRVEFYKGVGLLLEAWREIVKESPQAQLKIVGEGAQKQEYEKLVNQWGIQDKVIFADRVPWDQLRQEYDEAQIVVAPHLWVEPFGRTVVEAMARGKVVLAANRGGPSEIIQNGTTGLLFQSNSMEALLAALKQALMLPVGKQQTIGTAARDWVQQNLSIKTIALQYEQFYQELLNQ
jgi:glycosyltransferase involved in cell wall biosynthesis